MTDAAGGIVGSVTPGSPADRAGIRAGERIVAAERRPLADIIDWRWEASSAEVEVVVAGPNGQTRTVELTRVEGDWGIDFAEQLFDGVRECANACLFCFVRQLPSGLRPSLYVRDDDYRLSFLHGNFVTLTNLTEDDIQRILAQGLSPLYVSIHAVTPAARRKLMCPRHGDDALRILERLMRGGIDVHAQIVLVPGINDAEELEETLAWASHQERILSVGVVPMGYTMHQRRVQSSFGDPGRAAAVLNRVRQWQAIMRVERGRTWVQAADELYIASGRPLPAWPEYDDFPQYDNGVGLARAFLDEASDAIRQERLARHAPHAAPADVVLVTGELFAGVLGSLVEPLAEIGIHAHVLPVQNRLFGGNVSVAGLLGRQDIVSAIRGHEHPGPYLVPDTVVNSDSLFLDDLEYEGEPAGTLTSQTGRPVSLVPSEGRAWVEAILTLRSPEEG